ncbi:hypothetical protein [Cedecea sp. VD22]|uniref:hypothetical protein n=1 Tax=Cedecea sp. VD22 TaxID=3081243 RepID=UPI003018041B
MKLCARQWETNQKHARMVLGWLTAGAAGGGVAVLSVLLVVLFYQVADSGSAADWIASVANVAMAITAVCAFIVARSWLPQLTTQEGYKLAIELVNEHYIWLGIQNSVMNDVCLPVLYIRHQVDRESLSGSTVSAGELIKTLEQAVLRHKIRRDKMDQIRFRLNTYGLCVSHEYEHRFQALDTAYMHACDAAASILQILKETQALSEQYPSTDSPLEVGAMTRELYLPFLIQANEIYEKVDKQFQEMIKVHGTIFTDGPSIGKLFKVMR